MFIFNKEIFRLRIKLNECIWEKTPPPHIIYVCTHVGGDGEGGVRGGGVVIKNKNWINNIIATKHIANLDNKGNKLWEFIRDALKEPATCPSVVRFVVHISVS